ncbi:macrophage erythroblast attacher, putative [Babesia ovis]|uniref:Macrophage erythroblast attacher, putative n=1 Tax=Babesia ovis TaxID=5869 RepID=A0A9W5WTN6_BABOV|nr:macrophage erythroblast attacher, putative [Babesia ovis]
MAIERNNLHPIRPSNPDHDGPIRRPRRILEHTHSRSSKETQTPNAVVTQPQSVRPSICAVDRSLISAPYEGAQTSMKDLEHILEKELLLITGFLSKRLASFTSRHDVTAKLKRALERIQNLETAVRSIDDDLDARLSELLQRLDTLGTDPSIYNSNHDQFNFEDHRKRVSWVVAKYLARKGYIRTARPYVNTEQLDRLVDLDLFALCDRVHKELKAHKLDSALEWAESKKDILERHNSSFLYDLKVQHVVSHLKRNDIQGATELLRSFERCMLDRCEDSKKLFSALVLLKSLDANGGSSTDVISADGGQDTTLAVDSPLYAVTDPKSRPQQETIPPTDMSRYETTWPTLRCIYCGKGSTRKCDLCRRYTELMDDKRWDYISREFERMVAAVYGLNKRSLLESLAHTGLCAIKSTNCSDQRNATCPACMPELRSYTNQVPLTNKLDSVLICPITGELMGYDNPPYTSPSGCVISEHGIDILSRDSDAEDDLILCPRGQEMVSRDDFTKLFVT